MSTLFERLQQAGGRPESLHAIVTQFLNAANFDTGTEIVNPDGMTFLDLTVLYSANEEHQRAILGIKEQRPITDSDYLGYFDERLRKNYISNQRKGRGEAERVALGAKAEEEKRMKEKVLEGIGLR